MVSIADRPTLENFKNTWKYHHPLQNEQLDYAGIEAEVGDVGYYHGGDELYSLMNVPGVWHEVCLRPASK